MPYIKPGRRERLDQSHPYGAVNTGELNYMLTDLCREYLAAHGLTYRVLNDILGALEGAKLEFYRRVVVPYEDSKIKENGDVYPPS